MSSDDVGNGFANGTARVALFPFAGLRLGALWRRRVFSSVVLFAVIVGGGACGGSGEPEEDKLPEITVERIRESLDGERVTVPAEDGTSEPSSWRFYPNEPKEIEIVEKQLEGKRATFVIDLRTRTSPRAEQQGITKRLAGRLRLHYELRTYFAVRKWEIDRIDNLSFAFVKE